VHDLEDAVVTGTLSENQWHTYVDAVIEQLPEELAKLMQDLGEQLFAREHHLRKNAIGALVNIFVTTVRLEQVLPNAQEPLVSFNATLPDAQSYLLKSLKDVVFEHVINEPSIQQLRYRSQNMLLDLFTALHAEPLRLLPRNTRERWQKALQQQGQAAADRILCDYVAGMTDDYAERMYRNLFVV